MIQIYKIQIKYNYDTYNHICQNTMSKIHFFLRFYFPRGNPTGKPTAEAICRFFIIIVLIIIVISMIITIMICVHVNVQAIVRGRCSVPGSTHSRAAWCRPQGSPRHCRHHYCYFHCYCHYYCYCHDNHDLPPQTCGQPLFWKCPVFQSAAATDKAETVTLAQVIFDIVIIIAIVIVILDKANTVTGYIRH